MYTQSSLDCQEEHNLVISSSGQIETWLECPFCYIYYLFYLYENTERFVNLKALLSVFSTLIII